MTEVIAELFSKIFNGNVILATIIVSMVPIMELKGGIPFGMSEAFWGANALSRWSALGWAYLGCSIVVMGLYFTFVPIMKLLRKTKLFKGLAKFIENRVSEKTTQMEQSANDKLQTEAQTTQQDVNAETTDNTNIKINNKKRMLKVLGVFAFVAIPLPLTGVWMGVCIAVMMGLKFWETFVAVQLGNLVAGIIISTICVIFPQFTHILIYVFLILVIAVIIIEIIKNKINKNRAKIKNK